MNALIEAVPLSEQLPVLVHEGRRRLLAIAIAFAVIAVLGLLAGALWPKKFSASTTILVEESNIIKPLMEGRAYATGVADRAGIAKEVIFSRKIMTAVLASGGWLASHPSPIEQDRIIDNIKSRTTITSLRDNLIQISYQDSNAERAYQVTRSLADLFISESLDAKARESREAFDFIAQQVDSYHQKLTGAEDKLKAYRANNPDARPGSETDTNTRISELRRNIEAARMDTMVLGSQAAAAQGQLSGESEISAVQTRAGDYRARLAELQSQLDKLLLSYTNDYPDVIRTRHEIADLQESLKTNEAQRDLRQAAGTPRALDQNVQFNPHYQELRSKVDEAHRGLAAARARMSEGEAMLQQELARSGRIADSAGALAELTRDYEVNRDIYQDLLKRRENARVSMNLDKDHRGLSFSIQEPALLPLVPSGLRFVHFGMAGLGLALVLPLGLLFGFVRFDPRLRSADQLERSTGVPVLANIPLYRTQHDRRRERLHLVSAMMIVVLVLAAYAIAALLQMQRVL